MQLFETKVRELFESLRPRRIIETGTYHGTGTTQIICTAIRDLRLDAKFISIESNASHVDIARNNLKALGLSEYVDIRHGLSVSQDSLPSADRIKSELSALIIDYGDSVATDHPEPIRHEMYYRETEHSSNNDNLLAAALTEMEGLVDFVLLDSAGHLGFREFSELIKNLQSPCIIALDDTNHVKHIQSLSYMKRDSRFELLFEIPERWGTCFARFKPSHEPSRQRGYRVFYPLPGLPRNGGIKVCLQHSHLLNNMGIECHVVVPQSEPSPYPRYASARIMTWAECLKCASNTDKFVFTWAGALEHFQHLKNPFFFFSQGVINKSDPVSHKVWLNDRFSLISIGQHSRNFFFYGYGRNSKVVGNWIDTTLFHPAPHNKTRNRVGLIQHRNYFDEDVARQIQKLGFEPFVISGTEPDVAAGMQSCDFFLSLSKGIFNGHDCAEGFALPGAEAMACGAVLISYNNQGCLEYAYDNVNSFIAWQNTREHLIDRLLHASGSADLERIRANGPFTIQQRFNSQEISRQLSDALDLQVTFDEGRHK